MGVILSELEPAYIERLKERFWKKVDKSPGQGPEGCCWIWIGARYNNGYGAFAVDCRDNTKRKVNACAHRVSYDLFYGDLQSNLLVCHKCDNPPCVNHHHLFQATQLENLEDMVFKGRSPSGSKNGSVTTPQSRPRRASHGRSKLTEEDVSFIRANAGIIKQKDMAEMFGVHVNHIGSIVRGVFWKNG